MDNRPQNLRGRAIRNAFCAYVALSFAMCGLSTAAVAAQGSSQLSDRSRPNELQLWAAQYARARDALLREAWGDAARQLSALAASASSSAQRLLATELASIARVKLADSREQQPSLRTADELTTLYTTAIFYGLGASAWLALQVEPNNVAGALLPFALLTPAAVGVFAWADSYRPLRHGIPHAIAAGMYLGFGEGLWLAGFQSAYASAHDGVERWGPQRASTALWVAATAGGLTGALIGAVNRPTPGRVSFTASTAIWAGALAAFTAHAVNPDAEQRGQTTYLAGAFAYNAGLLAGIVFGPVIAPSIKRVRYTDLGGMFGAMLVGGGYALLVDDAESRVGLGLAAIGGALGLGLTVWATRGMAPDYSHDRLPPAIGRPVRHSAVRPTLSPTRGGFVAGLSGEL
jgi:hypothetical protein